MTERRLTARWTALVGVALAFAPYELAGVGIWSSQHRLQATLACIGMVLIIAAGALVGLRRPRPVTPSLSVEGPPATAEVQPVS